MKNGNEKWSENGENGVGHHFLIPFSHPNVNSFLVNPDTQCPCGIMPAKKPLAGLA